MHPEDRNFDSLVYPPNAGLTDPDKAELNKLDNNDNLKNALRKIIADNAAGVIFNMLNVLDGTGASKLKYDEWRGVKLVEEEVNVNPDPFFDTLHDSFFDAYWDWKRLRGEKPWKLDTYGD